MKRKIVDMIIGAEVDCSNERAERIADRAIELYKICNEDDLMRCKKNIMSVLTVISVIQSGTIKGLYGKKKSIKGPYGIDNTEVVLDMLCRVLIQVYRNFTSERENELCDKMIEDERRCIDIEHCCLDILAHAIYGICVSNPIATYDICDISVSNILYNFIRTTAANDIDSYEGVYNLLMDVLYICDIKQN